MSEARSLPGRAIGYEFANPELLEQALTHRSAGSSNYERLEFLGDGLLNFVVAEALYEKCPGASEGELTRLRASLVRTSTLAEIATGIRLGDYLRMGQGELGSGGFRRRSVLADALEALLGAVYLDGGFQSARTVVRGLFRRRFEHLPDPETLKDAKTRLQEWLQSRRLALPEYVLTGSEGRDHERRFTVSCRVEALALSSEATGSSLRRAEQAAAAGVLARIADA